MGFCHSERRAAIPILDYIPPQKKTQNYILIHTQNLIRNSMKQKKDHYITAFFIKTNSSTWNSEPGTNQRDS